MIPEHHENYIGKLLALARDLIGRGDIVGSYGNLGVFAISNLLIEELSRKAIGTRLDELNVSSTSFILYDSNEYLISITSPTAHSDYIHLRGHKYIDIPLLSEQESIDVNTYHYVGAGPVVFDLSQDLSASRLDHSSTQRIKSGDVVVNSELGRTSELVNARPFSVLRVMEKSMTPYELLFDRASMAFCGVMQRSPREATILTALELCSEMRLTRFIDDAVRLTDDENPLICWNALRALKLAPRETISEIIHKFRASPNEYIRRSAHSIQYGA
jgi:hypothetical protein